MSYWPEDRDPREAVAAVGIMALAALCWIAHLIARMPVVR